MRDLILIIKKELTELLRDKKTIINSIVLPTLLIPVLMFGGIKVSQMISESNQQKKVQIGLVNAPEDFMKLIKSDTLNEVINYTESIDFKSLIDDGTIQTALVFPSDWKTLVLSMHRKIL